MIHNYSDFTEQNNFTQSKDFAVLCEQMNKFINKRKSVTYRDLTAQFPRFVGWFDLAIEQLRMDGKISVDSSNLFVTRFISGGVAMGKMEFIKQV